MRKLLVLSLLLAVVSCSQSVKGIDKDIYTQAEEYAQSVYYFFENQNSETFDLEYIDEMYDFLKIKTNNNQEQNLIKYLGSLYVLQSLYIAEDFENSSPSEETIKQINEIIDMLETEYEMNIRND
ncbi:hypothetical protein V1503_18835 [Bacillus sp. SCS-151]|uniref:hypothetical protein n=1 Tax=Nanhaiella sioensis TaxID=3115293 RepID=UPI00397BFC12